VKSIRQVSALTVQESATRYQPFRVTPYRANSQLRLGRYINGLSVDLGEDPDPLEMERPFFGKLKLQKANLAVGPGYLQRLLLAGVKEDKLRNQCFAGEMQP
jgi:hypothetical protein